MLFRQNNFTALDVANFLRLVLRHLRGEVILLWDNGGIHKGPFIRQLQIKFPRLHLEPFPPYAPELNPVEFLWADIDGHMANSLLPDRQTLHSKLQTNKRRVQHSQRLLNGFISASDLPSPPW